MRFEEKKRREERREPAKLFQFIFGVATVRGSRLNCLTIIKLNYGFLSSSIMFCWPHVYFIVMCVCVHVHAPGRPNSMSRANFACPQKFAKSTSSSPFISPFEFIQSIQLRWIYSTNDEWTAFAWWKIKFNRIESTMANLYFLINFNFQLLHRLQNKHRAYSSRLRYGLIKMATKKKHFINIFFHRNRHRKRTDLIPVRLTWWLWNLNGAKCKICGTVSWKLGQFLSLSNSRNAHGSYVSIEWKHPHKQSGIIVRGGIVFLWKHSERKL